MLSLEQRLILKSRVPLKIKVPFFIVFRKKIDSDVKRRPTVVISYFSRVFLRRITSCGLIDRLQW